MTKLFTFLQRATLCVLPAWMGFTVSPSHGQDLRVHLSEDSVTVGQRFLLSIAAEHDFAADPVFPEATDTLTFGDLEVLGRRTRESVAGENTRIDSIVYEVTTFALDTAAVPPIRVLFTAGEDTFSVRTPPAHVAVISLVPADAQDVQDLAPLVEFPRTIWLYVVGGIALLLLAALLFLYLRKRRARSVSGPAAATAPAEPPDVEALARLKALEGTDLSRRETVYPFYVELSDIVRRYLARRLHVNAMESTTRELMQELSHRDPPSSDTRIALQRVLTLADFVKFADAAPDPAEGRRALSDARDIVASVEEDLRPPAPAAEPSRSGDHVEIK